MSHPTNNVYHHPETERNESFKDQDKFSSEGIKQFPNGNNTPPVNYPPRPPLQRIDSRSSFPIRPGFPNPQGVPIRPPGQQIRPPPPGTVFRPPQIPNRPPFQQGFPNNQLNQNIRPGGPNIRPPGVPFPPGSFPRGIPPGVRHPGMIHQRSEPNPEQQKFEQFSRSQTLDSTDINSSPPGHANMDNNEPPPVNLEKYAPIKSTSSSLNSSTTNLNEEPVRTLSRNSSIDDRKFTNSQESLERKSEHEYPSRPESRSSSRMGQILENNDSKNINETPDSILTQRPESRSSVSSKSSNPRTNSAKENIKEEKSIEQSVNKTSISREIKPSETPISLSTTAVKMETEKNIEQSKDSLQLKNLTKTKSSIKIEGDNDSGVDESTQGNDRSSNGDASPRKSASKAPKRISSATPSKARSLSRDSKSPSLKSPDSNATTPGTTERKKLPMNKVQVGSAPSPNLKEVRSKIGSLQNATHKPGGGNVKIETKKIELKNVTPRIEAKNDKYIPKGGEKKIISQKLQWNAKPKVGSLDNATHKPVSSGKKIETIKLDFKEKAKPKVGSKDNMKHTPGGGDIKIETKKLDFNVQSKVGSLDNVKHKPKGGDKKIFDDKEYLKQMSGISSENHSLSGSQADEYLYKFY
ncbi:translation initiation factor IF-2-like isoform X2 [Harmonia axyridis]|uniref:translation initiation factor IF-2-like isoform X2 n=1 Tax=Harmonia axyridis TaxID=115357 RepID=UPI001E279A25|nr:translation initiation factor IF-2-like isoform X2 [Harmonia axyridis]